MRSTCLPHVDLRYPVALATPPPPKAPVGGLQGQSVPCNKNPRAVDRHSPPPRTACVTRPQPQPCRDHLPRAMAASLATSVGGIELSCCVYNASGPRTSSERYLTAIASSRAGAVVSKSATPEARTGNPFPRYHEEPAIPGQCPGRWVATANWPRPGRLVLCLGCLLAGRR